MGVIEGTRTAPEGVGHGGALKVARGDYDFADDGGAQGDIDLMGVAGLPNGAIVVGGLLEVTTALASAGAATAALKVEGAGDIVADVAISGAPWSSAGLKDIVPDMSGSAAVKTTAPRDIVLTVGVADLTAGAFTVVLLYLEPLP